MINCFLPKITIFSRSHVKPEKSFCIFSTLSSEINWNEYFINQHTHKSAEIELRFYEKWKNKINKQKWAKLKSMRLISEFKSFSFETIDWKSSQSANYKQTDSFSSSTYFQLISYCPTVLRIKIELVFLGFHIRCMCVANSFVQLIRFLYWICFQWIVYGFFFLHRLYKMTYINSKLVHGSLFYFFVRSTYFAFALNVHSYNCDYRVAFKLIENFVFCN